MEDERQGRTSHCCKDRPLAAMSLTSPKTKGPRVSDPQAQAGATLPPPRLTGLGQAEAVDSSGEIVNPHIFRAISILMKFL